MGTLARNGLMSVLFFVKDRWFCLSLVIGFFSFFSWIFLFYVAQHRTIVKGCFFNFQCFLTKKLYMPLGQMAFVAVTQKGNLLSVFSNGYMSAKKKPFWNILIQVNVQENSLLSSSQQAFAYSKLPIETLQNMWKNVNDVVLVSLLLTCNIYNTFL